MLLRETMSMASLLRRAGSPSHPPQSPGQAGSRLAAAAGSASGAASILGSWQVCHNVCLGLVAMLAVLGITVSGMPLAFLTTVALPIWWIAVALLALTSYLYLSRRCISRGLIVLNAGLIIAGAPWLQSRLAVAWGMGGTVVAAGVYLLIADRRVKRCHTGGSS